MVISGNVCFEMFLQLLTRNRAVVFLPGHQQYNIMSKLLYQTYFIRLLSPPHTHTHTLAALSSSHFVTPHNMLLLIVSPTAQSAELGSMQIQILCSIITNTDALILQAHERTAIFVQARCQSCCFWTPLCSV